MRSHALFTLLVALLERCVGNAEDEIGIIVRKCCDEYEMLSGDGRSCVRTDWPPNAHVRVASLDPGIKVYFSPLNEDWLRRWLPPGIRLHRVRAVIRRAIYGYVAPVRTSRERNNKTHVGEDILRTQLVLREDGFLVRPKPGGGLRKADYCVDAALLPLGPFAMRLRTQCNQQECARLCCDIGHVMVNKDGNWMCEQNDQGDWTPFNASFARDTDPEFPFKALKNCPRLHLADPQDLSAHSLRYTNRQHFFSVWLPCSAYHHNVLSADHTSLQEGLFYCEFPQVARGIYWIVRPLCVVSTLLLAMALLSIACDGSMRRKVHGWCLASHALCLFGFNVGQIVYFVLLSDGFDVMTTAQPTPDIRNACAHFALMMYFLLTAAWFWLTALCTNMALGFRLQAATRSSSDKKRFLVLSILAWGLPALLTITCSFLFTPRDEVILNKNIRLTPSLAETRVCFDEPLNLFTDLNDNGKIIAVRLFSYKYGTALFYYGPALSLVLFNVASLLITLRKIKRLRRGNSVLRREEDLRHGQLKGNPPSAVNFESANGGTSKSGNGGSSRREVDSKTIKMYLKMILMTGALEIISEVIIWVTTKLEFKSFENMLLNDMDYGDAFTYLDMYLPYRSSGHVTDFLRAACVAWLAAPEGGYLGPILRRLRGEKK